MNKRVLVLLSPFWAVIVLGGQLTAAQAQPTAEFRDTADWTIEVVGPGGGHTSLALDASGNPHISYEGYWLHPDLGELPCLKYAHRVAGWHIEEPHQTLPVRWYTSLALDGNGNPHISCGGLLGLWYFHKETVWSDENIDPHPYVTHTSLVLGPGDNPRISYSASQEVGPFALKYAMHNGAWHTETLETQGWASGEETSLAIDASGYPHIAFVASYAVKYTYQDASGWHTEGIPDAGYDCSLALDRDGNPRVAYVHLNNYDLMYASRDGSGWHAERVDGGLHWSGGASLALDDEGYPHVSYYDGDDQDLKYAYKDATGWYTQTVDSAGEVGQYISMALDESGNPHISYYDATNDNQKYATTAKLPVWRYVYLPVILRHYSDFSKSSD